MAKTRMLKWMRDDLEVFARKNLETPKLQKQVDRQYESLKSKIDAAIAKKYPPEDMRILQRYHMSRSDECIRISSEGGQVQVFYYRKEDAPQLPNRYCSSRNIPVTKVVMEAVEKLELLKSELKNDRAAILNQFNALIWSVRYVDDLIEAWPGAKEKAEKWLNKSGSNQVVAVSPETLDFIKKTNITAKAA